MITKEQLDEYIAKYNRGEDTGLSDEEYDNLLEEYLKKNGEDKRPFLRTQQTDIINLSKEWHMTSKLSLAWIMGFLK